LRPNLWFLNRIIFFVIVIASSSVTDAHSEVGFDALHGSDLGMGIGARAVGLGGAFVSIADDASATFWNPAGLTRIRCNQFLVSADLPDGFSVSSIVYKPTFLELESVNFTIGLSLINRLRIKGASGDDTWSGHPSYILDLGMIEVEEDFSGSVNSKTYDTRLSLSFVHPQYTNLSIGLNLIHVC
jgi:hypothetical protein